ncbi:MAG: transcription elongation factor GreA [Firmicutes bacterium]|nr:transcription elongation factor GreA [Bacillota bacterium]
MAEKKELIMTREGLRKMEQELEELKTVRRAEVAARLKQAIEFGDISENSEYDDAKSEQAFIEGSIIRLEQQLKDARVIDENDVTLDVISEYNVVRFRYVESGEELEYQIVGSVEAQPLQGKISNESPVGKALLGHSVGDVVTMYAPAGQMQLEVLAISKQ